MGGQADTIRGTLAGFFRSGPWGGGGTCPLGRDPAWHPVGWSLGAPRCGKNRRVQTPQRFDTYSLAISTRASCTFIEYLHIPVGGGGGEGGGGGGKKIKVAPRFKSPHVFWTAAMHVIAYHIRSCKLK